MSDTTEVKLLGAQHIHSCKVKTGYKSNAVIVKERLIYSDGTSVPNLKVIDNPKRPVWITKPEYRTNKDKKEFESMDRVDKYTIPDAEMADCIYRALYNEPYRGYRALSVNDLCAKSPYIYGADISVEVIIRELYLRKQAKNNVPNVLPRRGMLDTETNILPERGGQYTTHISFTDENKPYIGILESAFVTTDQDGNTKPCDPEVLQAMYKEAYADFREKVCASNKKASGILEKFGEFTDLTIYVAKSVKDLILWALRTINDNNTDFMGIWNIKYDIQMLVDQLQELGIDPADAFSPRSLDPKYRYFDFRLDHMEVQHFTRKWHHVSSTSNAYWYCAQNLYSINRTPSGLSPVGYGLDAVLQYNKCGQKLKVGGPDADAAVNQGHWHKIMQENYPYEYALYSIFDVVPLQLMEWMNADIYNVSILLEQSTFNILTRQSRRYVNGLFFFALDDRYVLGSVGKDMSRKGELDWERTGGAVLNPERVADMGTRAITELPNLRTTVFRFVSDIDFTAMYPSISSGCNQSKGTLLSTVMHIKTSRAVIYGANMTVHLASPKANCMIIANTCYDLPTYSEIDDIVSSVLRDAA